MTGEFDPSFDFVGTELSPLETISSRKLPPGLTEAEALRVFFALHSSLCPILAHLPDYGFNLKTTREFLSVFAGQTLTIPSRRTLTRAWEDFQIWLFVETRVKQHGETPELALRKAALKFKLPLKKVTDVHLRFRRTRRAVVPKNKS